LECLLYQLEKQNTIPSQNAFNTGNKIERERIFIAEQSYIVLVVEAIIQLLNMDMHG